jgi:hypothetical protein
MPTVSVIMSHCNGVAFLARAVESVLAQTYRDFEFIIIDDGSTDASPQRLRELAARDARIKLVVRENRGLTKTLNEGVRLATGQYLARMDSDDVSYPDRFAKQVAYLDAHPDVVALGGAYEMIDDAGRVFHVMWYPDDDQHLQESSLSGRPALCHPLVMMRADAVAKVGGYDESFPVAQDNDLWLRLGEVGKLACLPDVLLQYRQHGKSVSEAKASKQIEGLQRGCEAACRRRGITRPFLAGEGWRADGSRRSLVAQHARYGWWALKLGHAGTAAVYGCKAIRTLPTASDGWRLLACAVRHGIRGRRTAL